MYEYNDSLAALLADRHSLKEKQSPLYPNCEISSIDIVETAETKSINIYLNALSTTMEERKCPKCGYERVHKHQSYTVKIKDVPYFGYQVILHIKNDRYKCQKEECNHTFNTSLDFLYKGTKIDHRITQRLALYALYLTKKAENSLHTVEQEVGISTEIIKDIIKADRIRLLTGTE